jgi:hypothetical protein
MAIEGNGRVLPHFNADRPRAVDRLACGGGSSVHKVSDSRMAHLKFGRSAPVTVPCLARGNQSDCTCRKASPMGALPRRTGADGAQAATVADKHPRARPSWPDASFLTPPTLLLPVVQVLEALTAR